MGHPSAAFRPHRLSLPSARQGSCRPVDGRPLAMANPPRTVFDEPNRHLVGGFCQGGILITVRVSNAQHCSPNGGRYQCLLLSLGHTVAIASIIAVPPGAARRFSPRLVGDAAPPRAPVVKIFFRLKFAPIPTTSMHACALPTGGLAEHKVVWRMARGQRTKMVD
jgi:hypothetical protein